ncbi:MAG: hypothetical protein KDJ97_16790 [Anaerolineae bacterium]|nr:hypothetical protein [Anaerolineae bacterium]
MLPMLMLEIMTYVLALWLGLYLIGRDPAKPQLLYAGLGLAAYAVSLAAMTLAAASPSALATAWLTRLHWSLLFVPAVFWLGAMIYLLPDEAPARDRLSQWWRIGGPALAMGLVGLSLATSLIFEVTPDAARPGPAYPIFVVGLGLCLGASVALIVRAYRAASVKLPLGLLLAAVIFFGLSLGLMLAPLDGLPRGWLVLGMSLDLAILGVVIAVLDAFAEGETLLPDFFRSLDGALLFVLIFAGPVVATMLLATGPTLPLLALLLINITAAIAVQIFADPLQSSLDRVAFAAFPGLRQARADLRTTASALPRLNEALDLNNLDEDEFIRLTRRTLSHLGNLPRLATSPLTRLPLIDSRLAERDAPDNTLERAAELKRLLAESIAQLKPPTADSFGTTEEWRHYNALYFPYVAGLRPYSRRAEYDDDDLDPAAAEALDWFRTYVPERTLYNWQNAAAKLVAQHLREEWRMKNGE